MQWNLESYKTKFTNLKCILHKFQPTCVALQETLHKGRQVKPPSQYKIITSEITRQDNHERGTALLIHNSYNNDELQLNTRLQVCAAKLYLDTTYTLCSLCLPHIEINEQEIIQLINQLSAPFIIMGDMNARSRIWGDTTRNNTGKILEEILQDSDVVIINDGTNIHYHRQTNTFSGIDLTVCSLDCQVDFSHKVLESRYDCDNDPIQIEIIYNNVIPAKINKFNVKKAGWAKKALTKSILIFYWM